MWFSDQQSLRSACAYAQSDQSLCLSLEYSMSVKLLTEHHLEFLSLKGSSTGSSESTFVKMLHYWKSHVRAQLFTGVLGIHLINGSNEAAHIEDTVSLVGSTMKISVFWVT